MDFLIEDWLLHPEGNFLKMHFINNYFTTDCQVDFLIFPYFMSKYIYFVIVRQAKESQEK